MVTEKVTGTNEHLPSQSGHRPAGREGFTIVEVVIAIVILAVGLLGLAGTTVLMIKQTTLADVTSDRAAVLQSAIEQIRSVPYDDVESGSEGSGLYEVAWSVRTGNRWKDVEVVTTGPGLVSGNGFPAISHAVADTFTYRIISQ